MICSAPIRWCNTRSAASHSDGWERGAGWRKQGASSGKEYISLSIAAPEFGPRRLYANLGQAAGSEDPDVFAVIWNPID